MLTSNLIWAVIGFTLTVLVLSYLAGDNLLFRFVIYAFVGMSAAYVTLIVITQVLWPQVALAIINGSLQDQVVGLVGFVLCILLCGKLVPRLAKLGAIPMGYLVGVGAAIAIGGGVVGTIIPQVLGSVDISWLHSNRGDKLLFWSPLLNGIMILVGTITTLIYFHYGAKKRKNGKIRRGIIIEALSWVGKVFIAISLGAIFAGVFSASLSALVERISFLIYVIRTLVR